MPVDSSIALGIKPIDIQNPLALAEQGAKIQNAMNLNKLIQSRQAAGQAFQQSIGPDGLPNQNLLMQNLAHAGPDAAMSAQESANSGQALATANLGFNDAQRAILGRNLGAMLTLPPDQQTRQNYEQMLGYLHKTAGLDDTHLAQALQRLPSDGSPPGAFQQFGQQILIGSLAGPQVAQQAFGTPVSIDNGQALQGGVQQSPVMGGAVIPHGPATPVGLPSRTTLIQQTPGFDPTTGAPVATPLGVRAAQQGMGGQLGPAGQAIPNARQGRYPTASAQTGPALGQQEAASVSAAENAKQGVSLAQTADQVPTRKAALDNMLSDLQTLNTGPGADWEKTANALSSRLTGLGITMSPDQIAKQESFAKLSKQIALAQTSALGAGTDEKLTTALGANPNTDLSKLGNTQIVGMLKGNEDAIALKNLSWQQYQAAHGPQSYGQFSTQFNHTFDPRALQAVYMDPADKAKLAGSLSKDPLAKARFIATLKQGMAAGIIQAPTNGQ
jgi:hypothetical protein